MNKQQTPQQPPSQEWTILIWIGFVLFGGTIFAGIYAIIAKHEIAFSVISFILAIAAIPLGILQVKRDAFKYVWRTRKTGRLVIGIAILFFSLTMNVYAFVQFRASTSVAGTTQRSPSTISTPSTVAPTMPFTASPEATKISVSCTDTEYVADFYGLASPYPQAMKWFGWLRQQGWKPDGAPTPGDILVINANKQGVGPDGYVGVIQQPVTDAGIKKWTMTIRSTGISGETPVADAHCSNVADFIRTIAADHGDGVAFFHK